MTNFSFDEDCEGELPEYPYKMSMEVTATERLRLRLPGLEWPNDD